MRAKEATARVAKSARTARKIKEVLQGLDELYPKAHCELTYGNPLQLLVATILSAQCTDERVNKVTRPLFMKYRTAKDYADADPQTFQQEIRPTGFFRNKQKNIRRAAELLAHKFGGKVPGKMDLLLELPGVARKTANVLLGTAFGVAEGVVVDTHVRRVAQRLGLTDQDSPEKIEQDLMRQIPRDLWISFSHQLIWHGRRVCAARKPLCGKCNLTAVCDYFRQVVDGHKS